LTITLLQFPSKLYQNLLFSLPFLTLSKIKVYRNGDANSSFDLKVNSEFKPKDLGELIETQLKLKPVQKLRLFTSEGLEISIEELNYIKNGEAIYASRGIFVDKNEYI